jgi:RNA polymerase sigma factor (sigma-70 family)
MEEKKTTSQINALYDRAVRGDDASEELLFQKLRVRFLYIANQRVWDRVDAEDVVQVALAAVHREYRGVAVRESFAAWAHRVLDNRILGYIQKKARRDRIQGENTGGMVGSGNIAPDPDLRRRLLNCLRRLGRWNVKYARVLNLSHQGYRTEEISGRLGITSNHLYVILSRARSMLRACLETGRIR